MIAKCTKCGHQQREDRPAYSSPVVQCQACGTHYYEKKFREAALEPPPAQTAYWESYDFFPFVMLVIIDILLILFAKKRDAAFWEIFSGIAFFTVLASISVVSAYIKDKRYKRLYAKVIEESKQRLRSKEYRDLLLQASGNNPELARALGEHIPQDGSVLHNGSTRPNSTVEFRTKYSFWSVVYIKWAERRRRSHRTQIRRLGLLNSAQRWARRWRRKSRARENLVYPELFTYKNRVYNRQMFAMLGSVKLQKVSYRERYLYEWLLDLRDKWENDLLITKEPDYVLAKLDVVNAALSWYKREKSIDIHRK